MRLFWSSRSPYARKATVVAHELGLSHRIECQAEVVTLRTRNAAVAAHNPLGQIPTLVLADGTALYDSCVIAEYLCSLSPGTLLPDGAARLPVLCRQALGDGMLDALMRWYSERARGEDERAAAYVTRAKQKLAAAVESLEREVGVWQGFDLGQATIAIALCYADFRFGEAPWREKAPALAEWHARVERRPSFIATAFKDEAA